MSVSAGYLGDAWRRIAARLFYRAERVVHPIPRLMILDRVHLTPRSGVCVVRFGEELLVVGIAGEGIQLLRRRAVSDFVDESALSGGHDGNR